MTPQSRKEFKPPVTSSNDYGMDLNSDDSTDDESQPRKPVPAWATGMCPGPTRVSRTPSRLWDLLWGFAQFLLPGGVKSTPAWNGCFCVQDRTAAWSSLV